MTTRKAILLPDDLDAPLDELAAAVNGEVIELTRENINSTTSRHARGPQTRWVTEFQDHEEGKGEGEDT